jgi:hypothetical protein
MQPQNRANWQEIALVVLAAVLVIYITGQWMGWW